MVGRSSSGSRTVPISPTMGSSSASMAPGSGGDFSTDSELRKTENGNTYKLVPMTAVSPLTLPMEIEDIKAVLPHRYPFLLLDRVLELEPDRRCVALKNVASDERYFIAGPGGRPTLPASILTEAMAQTGAMLILTKPENRSRLIYFMGIDRVRYRRPVVAGDRVMLEATVVRLRAKMGTLRGIARVDGHVVLEGQMTFALADRPA